MNNTVVLFTANTQGGIIQFTVQLFHVLRRKNFNVYVYIPENVKNTDLSEVADFLILYKKEKRVFDSRSYQALANKINELQPSFIWFMDNSVVSQKVGLYINKQVKQFLTMHDAGNYHPTNKTTLRSFASNKYNEILSKRYFKKVFRFVLLSKESVQTFQKNVPDYQRATILMNLGAHLPLDEEILPPEAKELEEGKYYLFFGRIDKYKGIGTLLRTYNAAHSAYPLVIAGNGKLTEEEHELLQKCTGVVLINRYILDGEMKWLLSHSMSVCLPYIEATQSGIIPLAYFYKKPAIISNVPGLTQFVQDYKTGIICSNDEEWIQIFNTFTDEKSTAMKADIAKYYKDNLDWDTNIQAVLDCVR